MPNTSASFAAATDQESLSSSQMQEEEATEEEKSPVKSDENVQIASYSRQRTVSFNEDAIVTSFDKTEAPATLTRQEKESLKKDPQLDMSIDEMIRKVEEKDDGIEESGNNYEVCIFLE